MVTQLILYRGSRSVASTVELFNISICRNNIKTATSLHIDHKYQVLPIVNSFLLQAMSPFRGKVGKDDSVYELALTTCSRSSLSVKNFLVIYCNRGDHYIPPKTRMTRCLIRRGAVWIIPKLRLCLLRRSLRLALWTRRTHNKESSPSQIFERRDSQRFVGQCYSANVAGLGA